MKVEIEIDVPEGFEFVGYRHACRGDLYLKLYFSGKGEVDLWTSGFPSCSMYPILRKRLLPTEADVGKRVNTTGMGSRGELLGVYGDYAWLLLDSGGAPITKPLDLVVVLEGE